MIFDIHNHLLPYVDDGAKNETITKHMLKIAADEGIDIIVATPHFASGMDREKVEDIKRKYAKVRTWWKKLDPNKELCLGNEIYYGEEVVDALEQGLALTMNGTRYVLVEFSEGVEFSCVKKAVQKLQYAGYFPIIAHVERYTDVWKRSRIQELVGMGAYIQVNVSAILGKHGFREKYYAMRFIKLGLVHFIGTDAHGSHRRKPEMKQCVQYLEKKLGVSKAHQLLEGNPRRMLKGEELHG